MGKDDDEKRPRVVGPNAADPGCNDVIMAILWVAMVASFIVIGLVFLGSGGNLNVFTNAATSAANDQTVQALALGAFYTIICCLLWVSIYLVVLKQCAYFLIVWLNIAFVAILATGGSLMIYYATEYRHLLNDDQYYGFVIGGAMLCAGSILWLLWFCCIYKRIALTARILGAVAGVLAEVPGTIMVSYLYALITIGWFFFWSMSALQCTQWLASSSPTNQIDWGSWIGLMFGLITILYWGYKALITISFVTSAGVVGEYYWRPECASEGVCFCRPILCRSHKRAVSNFLGSIAFGSLIVAILEAIYWVCAQVVHKLMGPNPNLWVKLAGCCFLCMLACLKNTIEWLTEWAYAIIAIYGVGFCTAGGMVVKLLRDSGMGALSQSTLIYPVLTLAAAAGGAIGVGCGYLAFMSQTLVPSWAPPLAGFFFGWAVTATGLSCVDAGCKAMFVCYADDPEPMQARVPVLFGEFVNAPKGDAVDPKGVELSRAEGGKSSGGTVSVDTASASTPGLVAA